MTGLAAGKLRHWVDIEEKSITQDSDGELVESWVFVSHVPAAIEPLSGREFIAADALQSKLTTRITIRALDAVKAAMRIVHTTIHGTHVFNIEAVLRDKWSNIEYMSLMCSEGVNDG